MGVAGAAGSQGPARPRQARSGHSVPARRAPAQGPPSSGTTYPSSAGALGPLRRARGLQSPGVKCLKVTTGRVREAAPTRMTSGLRGCCKQESEFCAVGF